MTYFKLHELLKDRTIAQCCHGIWETKPTKPNQDALKEKIINLGTHQQTQLIFHRCLRHRGKLGTALKYPVKMFVLLYPNNIKTIYRYRILKYPNVKQIETIFFLAQQL